MRCLQGPPPKQRSSEFHDRHGGKFIGAPNLPPSEQKAVILLEYYLLQRVVRDMTGVAVMGFACKSIPPFLRLGWQLLSRVGPGYPVVKSSLHFTCLDVLLSITLSAGPDIRPQSAPANSASTGRAGSFADPPTWRNRMMGMTNRHLTPMSLVKL